MAWNGPRLAELAALFRAVRRSGEADQSRCDVVLMPQHRGEEVALHVADVFRYPEEGPVQLV